MDAQKLLPVHDRLDDFLAQFRPHFGRRRQRDQLALYARGRLGPLDRKSLKPIVLAEGGSPRVLQIFINEVGIPEEIAYLNHTQMSIKQLRRIRKNGVPGRWVSGDCEFGGSWEWREEVAQMDLLYVAEVPDTTHGYWRSREHAHAGSVARGLLALARTTPCPAHGANGDAQLGFDKVRKKETPALSSGHRHRCLNTQTGSVENRFVVVLEHYLNQIERTVAPRRSRKGLSDEKTG